MVIAENGELRAYWEWLADRSEPFQVVPRHGRGICGIIRHMEEIVPHQKLHNATSPKVSPANWLVLDEALKAEWEREASNAASEICRKKISVIIGLPGKN